MSRQQELVAYVAQFRRGSEAAAREWLDANCPEWQSGRLVEVGVIELPAEEVSDA